MGKSVKAMNEQHYNKIQYKIVGLFIQNVAKGA